MRKEPKLLVLVLLLISIVFAFSIGGIEKNATTSLTYPATVCPGNLSDGSNSVFLPNSKINIASIPSKLGKLKGASSANLNSNKPLLIDGGNVTSLVVTKSAAGGLGASICSISDGNDWFIGGSSSVSSKGTLALINSGLSSAQVDINVYSSKASAVLAKPIPANSEVDIPLDSLAPGDNSIALNVLTRSGRVSSFVFDNRKSGLRAMGADFVTSSVNPATKIVIPNIPRVKSKTSGNQSIRIVVPGSSAAHLKATVYSSDGSFAPIGLDGANIPGGFVKDIDFNPIIADSSFSLVLESDVPIGAAVQSIVGGDLVWSTAVAKLDSTSIQIGGFKPLIRFYGAVVNVNLNMIESSGKRVLINLSGNDTVSFRPKNAIIRATFTSKLKENYGAMIIDSGNGFAQIPITSGSHLESSAAPKSEARTINRG